MTFSKPEGSVGFFFGFFFFGDDAIDTFQHKKEAFANASRGRERQFLVVLETPQATRRPETVTRNFFRLAIASFVTHNPKRSPANQPSNPFLTSQHESFAGYPPATFQTKLRRLPGVRGQNRREGRLVGFAEVGDQVAEMDVVSSIANRLSTSATEFKRFIKQIRAVLALGVGVGALVEAVAVAGFLGLSVLSVQVVAILLILWALSEILPSILESAFERFRKTFSLID